jgi:hypothetical protein
LKPTEHVHHKNGNKRDNRPENLMIVSPSQHIYLTLHSCPQLRIQI